MNLEEIKEQLIKTGVFNHGGYYNPNYKLPNYINLSEIEGETLKEKVWVIFKNNGVHPKCPICGKPSRFRNYSQGCYVCCSNECKKILDKNNCKANAEKMKLPENQKRKLEKIRQTCIERYGVDNPQKSKEIREKTKQTCLEKYGTENPGGVNFEGRKAKWIEKYGYDNPAKVPEIREKISKANKETFNPSSSTWERIHRTNIERYGVENPMKSKEIKNKLKSSFIDKFGVDNPSKLEEFREKRRKTTLDRYGVEYPIQNKEIKERIRQTNLERYGIEYPAQNPDIKKKIFSHKDMTIPEKKMDEFLSSRGFEYEYEYECNRKNFDFAIFNNGELIILVEIDGEYVHGLKNDPDGHLVGGFNDEERFSKVPEGVKFIVVDSMRIEEAFAEILRVFNIDYEEWIQEIINSLPYEFPFYEYNEKRMRDDYKRLCNNSEYKPGARLADSTIKTFHKSIYYARVGNNPSPYEAWYDPELVDRCVRNRFIYSCSLSSNAILNGFNVCKIAPKVSVFSASLAKYIVDYFIDESNVKYNTIFDPFSGFSGRLLGVCSSGKKYIGQDINQTHVDESNAIIQFHNLNAEVTCKDIFESNGKYECLFTCPPYNLKETWNNNNQADLSCDEWIDACLERFECNKYIFVVDKTEKYKDNIVWEISNKSHFSKNKEYVVLL